MVRQRSTEAVAAVHRAHKREHRMWRKRRDEGGGGGGGGGGGEGYNSLV